MIKLIVGLGNPGQQYEKTRHNVGFLFLDYLLVQCCAKWIKETRFHGKVASAFVNKHKVLLLKPQTFMNRSGLSVVSIAKFYKFVDNEILVVHDELDFDSGVVKLKIGGGHAGHNGLRDIMVALKSKEFCRVRIGIGRSTVGKPVSDYVLSSFSKSEQEKLFNVFDLLYRQLNKILSGEIAVAMCQINSQCF